MGAGEKIESRGHIIGFREDISKAALSSDEEKTVVEIGYGGGRLLAAASRHFKTVIGIDVHVNSERVEAELKRRGVTNARLIRSGGMEIPLEAASADFVYSFIVLQHVEKIEIFAAYLKETFRVLKTGGIALLYFGRKQMFSGNRGVRLLHHVDMLLERILMPKGYLEVEARVNWANLFVSLPHAKRMASEIGFQLLAQLVTYKHGPGGARLFGGQYGLVLKKP